MNDLTLEENFLLIVSATLVDKKPNELLKSGGLFGAMAILSAHLTQLGETGAYPILQKAIRVAYETVKQTDNNEEIQRNKEEIKKLTQRMREMDDKREIVLANKWAYVMGIFMSGFVGFILGYVLSHF